jgi:hypothetical protein
MVIAILNTDYNIQSKEEATTHTMSKLLLTRVMMQYLGDPKNFTSYREIIT